MSGITISTTKNKLLDDTLPFEQTNPEAEESCNQKILIFVSHDPSHSLSHLALRFAKSAFNSVLLNGTAVLHNTDTSPVEVFFYADAANTANRLRWQPADQINITKEWQKLALNNDLELNVCVSTAMSRGIIDRDNAKRHNLIDEGHTSDNLADGFKLVGLSELITKLKSYKLVQF